jgi:hypothetical protein
MGINRFSNAILPHFLLCQGGPFMPLKKRRMMNETE